MDVTASAALRRLIARVQSDPEALALILFGSQARDEASPAPDVGVCVVLDPDVPSGLPASRKRIDRDRVLAKLDEFGRVLRFRKQLD